MPKPFMPGLAAVQRRGSAARPFLHAADLRLPLRRFGPGGVGRPVSSRVPARFSIHLYHAHFPLYYQSRRPAQTLRKRAHRRQRHQPRPGPSVYGPHGHGHRRRSACHHHGQRRRFLSVCSLHNVKRPHPAPGEAGARGLSALWRHVQDERFVHLRPGAPCLRRSGSST